VPVQQKHQRAAEVSGDLYVPLRKSDKGEETLILGKAVPHFIFQIRDVNAARKARSRHHNFNDTTIRKTRTILRQQRIESQPCRVDE
jgi:hypothetical protein